MLSTIQRDHSLKGMYGFLSGTKTWSKNPFPLIRTTIISAKTTRTTTSNTPLPIRLTSTSTSSFVSSSSYASHMRLHSLASASKVSGKDMTENEKPDEQIKKENDSPRKQRVLSGVQPTGSLHLGNYLGAIRQWVINQEKYDSLFCVVDLHAITAPHDPKELRESTLNAAALYIAAGIDPTKSSIFIQSHVPAHSELCWLLNCMTPMNWLERMIQFKEKSQKLNAAAATAAAAAITENEDGTTSQVQQDSKVGVGLFDYPVLMASDILLYQANLVPVGEDQRQHLELTRDIARRFNDMYCKKKKRNEKAFTEPQALIVKEGARVMSLTDGTSKMSKSNENDNSRINLLDTPQTIMKKIKRCKTDAFSGLEWDNPDRPEATNLLNIYQSVTNKSKQEILNEVSDMNWGTFKPILADAVISHLEPIQKRHAEVMKDKGQLYQILEKGANEAEEIAQETLQKTQQAMGFLTRKDIFI